MPDLTPFGHDEALEAGRARPIWYGARPVESEITSWWIPDPAGLLYFFALAEAFPSPAVARVLLLGLANVAAVALTYMLASRFFGSTVGLVAGLLYALNPWAVTFARQPWVITQPLLTAVMLLCALMVVVRRDRRWVVPFFVALAAQTQTHLLAVLYGPPVLLTLLLFARRWIGRELAVALLLATGLVAPYGLHVWGLRDEIFEALARGNRGLTLAPDGTAVRLVAWLLSGYGLDAKLGLPSPILEVMRLPLLVATVALSGLLLTGIGRSIAACIRRTAGWEAHALLLIWFVGPLALMTWQNSAVYVHYVLVLLPTPFILVAGGLAGRWRRAGQSNQAAPPDRPVHSAPPASAHPAVWSVVCAISLVYVATLVGFYAALEASLAAPRAAVTPSAWQAAQNRAELAAKQAGIGEIHGLPLRYWQSVADRAKDAARSLSSRHSSASTGPADLVALTGIADDANRHLDERRKALDYLLGPEVEARFPLEGLTVLPRERDTLFLTLPEQDLPGAVQRNATRLAELPLPGTNGSTRLWLVRARQSRDAVQPRARADARLEPGVRLLGLDAPSRTQPGQAVAVVSYWEVDGDFVPSDRELAVFVELLDGANLPVARQVRSGLPSRQWRNGDVLVQRGALTLPPSLPAGQYRAAAGIVPLDDVDGVEVDLAEPGRPGRSVPVSTVRVGAP